MASPQESRPLEIPKADRFLKLMSEAHIQPFDPLVVVAPPARTFWAVLLGRHRRRVTATPLDVKG
jgi:hypothetical protein